LLKQPYKQKIARNHDLLGKLARVNWPELASIEYALMIASRKLPLLSPCSVYFFRTGMVVNVALGVARNPSALMAPPDGVSNSTVPRFPAVAA
jgi:hypothetical protein